MNSDENRIVDEVKTIFESGLFDQDYYRSKYPDVAASGMHPIEHYVLYGANEGRNPRKDFSSSSYKAKNPDAEGVNPFAHYIKHLKAIQERSLNPKASESSDIETSDTLSDQVLETQLFDHDYYALSHAEIEESVEFLALGSKYAALTNYISNAKAAGHNPCELFDTGFYLKTYPDVARSTLNPLVHFSRFGALEFRNPSADFDTGWYWLNYQQNEEKHLNPLVHYKKFGREAGLDTKPKNKSELSRLDDLCKAFLAMDNTSIDECINVARYLERIGRLNNAELVYSHICNLERNSEYFNTLARLYAAQRKWWQAIDTLNSACELDSKQPEWWARLGELLEKMNRFKDAIAAYSKAVELQSKNEQWWYRLGFLYEKNDDSTAANECYQKSIALSTNSEVKRFGVAIHHQNRRLWKEAAVAYNRQLEKEPLDAELQYRLGMAYDRCFEWELAAKFFKIAISLNPNNNYWFYRLGFVLERAKRYEESALAYSIAAGRSKKHEGYWLYRQGFVLQKAGKFEEACNAYLQTIKAPPTISAPEALTDVPEDEFTVVFKTEQQHAIDTYVSSFSRTYALNEILAQRYSIPKLHVGLAEELEKSGDWSKAAEAYERGIRRSTNHVPAWHYQRGYCLMRAGDFESACHAFENTRIIKKAYGFDYARYEKNATLKHAIEYNELIETHPINNDIVFYESYHGASVSCNPLAIFNEISKSPDYKYLTHVWALNNPDSAPNELKHSPSVIIVERNSYLYRYYIATAKYLINNNTFMPWFVRRPEQKYLNTWHGTPMKSLGKDIKSTFMSHKNVTRNFLHSTHLISPNSHTTDVMIDRHDISGSFDGIIAQTGYPRNDRVLQAIPEVQDQLIKILKIDTSKPTVLYAPTWRGTTSQPLVDTERLISDINALSKLDCNLLFRGHHMSEKQISQHGFDSVPAEIETSELLSVTDILITDYSSICFDFMPKGKPVIYYAYDYEEYRKERGLYLDIYTLPGVVAQSIEALCNAINKACGELDRKLAISIDNAKYLDVSNGNATVSAVKLFFQDDLTYAVNKFHDSRKSILIYAGSFPANGITQSCISLIKAIDSSKYRVVLVIDPDTIEVEQYRLTKLESISDKVQIISRVGIMNFSPEEKLVVDTFNEQNTLHSNEMWNIYRNAMRKEFQRIFGCANFDAIIQFEGYGKFWTALLAHGTDQPNKLMYLHNNMFEEFQTKYDFLEGIFKLYPGYKKLVSVSESVNQHNIANLVPLTNIPSDRFIYCDNYVNVEEILEKSKYPLDDDIRLWVGNSILFGTVGRLSPEKGHYKLITAFSEVLKVTNKDLKLVIVGDGSQWSILQKLISDLGLIDRVLLAGIRPNPYPLIKAVDLFVFSSDHEGQGLAIIEALILDKPVISTDIPGPHSILSPGYGKLVPNDEVGLINGMVDHLSNPQSYLPFIVDEYLENVDKMFYQALN